jgi:hypothetical protein
MARQSPGTRIPDLPIVDITGTPRNLDQYTGKKHIVLVLLRGLW